jgi:putative tricarboxylic transport membrane protein
MKRLRELSGCALAALCAVAIAWAPTSAQAKFPDRTITIVMPFGGGGNGDTMLRFLAESMKKTLGVPVVVVNRPGSGGAVGWKMLQATKPDGYTISYASTSLFVQTVRTNGTLSYENFDPVVALNFTPYAISVNPSSPWHTLKEFVEYAKANPGKVRVGNSGAGAVWDACAQAFENVAGVKFTRVPFKGGAEAVAALMGGHIEATSVTINDVPQLVEAGSIRVLAIGADKRSSFFPNIPTAKEQGYNLSMGNWVGVIAPKGTPKADIKILADAFQKAIESPDWKEFAAKQKIETDFDRGDALIKIYHERGSAMVSFLKNMK